MEIKAVSIQSENADPDEIDDIKECDDGERRLADDLAEHLGEVFPTEEEVDEAGSGDLAFFYQRIPSSSIMEESKTRSIL